MRPAAGENRGTRESDVSPHKVAHGNAVEYALALKGANQRRMVMRADGTIASSEGQTAIDRNE